jgi:hypothetical protein
MSITYYVVVSFDRAEGGGLVPPDAEEAASASAAERAASRLFPDHVGAVAFSRSGDPTTGEFANVVILAQYGDVELDALSE